MSAEGSSPTEIKQSEPITPEIAARVNELMKAIKAENKDVEQRDRDRLERKYQRLLQQQKLKYETELAEKDIQLKVWQNQMAMYTPSYLPIYIFLQRHEVYKTFSYPSRYVAGKETTAYILDDITEDQLKKFSYLIRKDEIKDVYYFTREELDHYLNFSGDDHTVDFVKQFLFKKWMNKMTEYYREKK